MANNYVEDFHQELLISWAKRTKIDLPGSPVDGLILADFLIAIPNGGKRNIREGARLKKQGVQAGVPDLMLHIPTKKYGALWIEMKRPESAGFKPGRLTQKQKTKLKQLNDIGYSASVAYGTGEAIIIILEYLSMPETTWRGF